MCLKDPTSAASHPIVNHRPASSGVRYISVGVSEEAEKEPLAEVAQSVFRVFAETHRCGDVFVETRVTTCASFFELVSLLFRLWLYPRTMARISHVRTGE